MLSTLKKIIPLSWRDRLRPQWEMLQEECKELAFPLQHSAARTKKSGLQAAANLEEAFRFAQTEFFICQHSGEILPALQYIQGIKPIVVGEVGTLNSGNAFLFLQAFSELRTLIAVDLHVRNRAKLRVLCAGVGDHSLYTRLFVRSTNHPTSPAGIEWTEVRFHVYRRRS